MLRFVLRRLAILVGALFVSSIVIFLALQMAPGDPLTTLSGGRSLPPAALENLREQYHLNEGLPAQYWHWLTGVLHGDLGDSIVLHQSVATAIGERLAVTLELVLFAGVLIALGGIGLGLLAGLRRGPVDTTIVLGTAVAAAIPSFLAAVVLLSVFSVGLGWLPTLGAGSGVVGRFEHLILPAVALALSGFAVVARITRVSVREESETEHVETARGRGMSNAAVIRRHVLRNAAIPITTVTGITITSLIALSAVVERAFSLEGLGAALVEAASNRDVALVQGISLVLVAAFLIGNTIVDLLYGFLDPRVRLGARAE
ncbi:MAG TPA: ABC transporter permease [Solirubrobacterales bacterium]|nr:ABC transporter permease [Solirubrobacterales bacterium]